ncbi:MAG: GxxExxY protein [Verrucomicrobiales bacterium]|jgi:GxxExxY protein|nr:GxxExxY protein [Verrucomicrobiales bacterium]
MEYEQLTGVIIGCAMKVHSALGPGFLESVYQKALAHELQRSGLRVASEYPVAVWYEGVKAGDFSADLLVEDCVLLELKANQTLSPANEAQLVNYLTATKIEIGLLLNFGAVKLEFKRKTRTYQPRKIRQGEQDSWDGPNKDWDNSF